MVLYFVQVLNEYPGNTCTVLNELCEHLSTPYGYLSSRIAESSELADRLIVTPRVRDGLFLGGTGDLFGDDNDTGVRASFSVGA